MKKLSTLLIRKIAAILTVSCIVLAAGPIMQAQSAYIYIYSPYTGQITYRNTPVNITWYSYGADSVNIEYSLDTGSTWIDIAVNYTGFDYLWTTPDTTTDHCIVKITSVSDTSVFGTSGPFLITAVPTLVLTSPNGGETWNYGNLETVSWTGTNLPYYLYMDYSIDGGSTWNSLGSAYSDSTGGTVQAYVPFVSSANSLVKIYDPYYPELISDISDQPFTIFTPPIIMYYPYDGDEFYIKEETYISWIATGVSLVNIDLTTDGGITWQQVDQNIDASYGYYYWTVTGIPSQNCMIRVSDATDPSKYGLSGTFTLLATPVITLSAPTGGEILNTNAPFTITWTYDNPEAYYLYLEYSTDNGQYWNYIDFVPNTGTQGSYEWTTPATESEQCLIRISDYYLYFVGDSSGVFSVLSYPETPICMVTVDSATNRNVIVWEKPVSPLIDQFIVYKESGVAGMYEPIGTLGYNDFSTFTDTNSNPAMKSYRYKLGFSDGLGHTFPAGSMHQTIHLSINKGVGNSWNLIWTDYIGFIVGSYNIYRGTDTSDMTLIGSISASFTSYTDLDAPGGYIYYMVEVVNPNGCLPTLKSDGYGTSRSNIATNKFVGIDDPFKGTSITVYPNPANDLIRVNIAGQKQTGRVNIVLRDLLGQVVYTGSSSGDMPENEPVIEVRNLPEGVYLLTVSGAGMTSAKKVIVKH